jgi:hypothetical protein
MSQGDTVGSESDRRVQIQNFGTTAESDSRNYALCSRNTWLAVFSADRRDVHVEEGGAIPLVGLFCSKLANVLLRNWFAQTTCCFAVPVMLRIRAIA